MQLFDNTLIRRKISDYDWDSVEFSKKEELAKQYIATLKGVSSTKETSFQGQFLLRLFEEILGYDSQSKGSDYSLIQEYSISGDSSDGALGFFRDGDIKDCRVVIELKDSKTHLDQKQMGRDRKESPVEQGYRYASKLDGCRWIIVSNFKKLRLYSKQRSLDYYEEFDLEDLQQEDVLKKLILLLNNGNLISDATNSMTEHLMSESQRLSEEITTKFYSEYRDVRGKLLNHLLEHNPEKEKVLILEKTQKVLDRFIFILFCEDSSVALLDNDLSKRVYDQAKNSFLIDDQKIWIQFKGLFHSIDKGNSTVSPAINAYNGGLFAKDDELDSLVIKDDIWEDLVSLNRYDFQSQLNVNVLGHIFENSISDLEQMKAELRGEEVDKKKSKRKKDGIYYTPEYITRYIVDSTVGRVLEDNPLAIKDIKIVDIACGSGAFLNQAHTYLSAKYKEYYEQGIIKSEHAEYGGLFDYNPQEKDKSILLDNLYGVDLNQESVEITKLALWLKTAEKSSPLQNLDQNVKCGNSLISDPEIVGESAFDYQEEFRDIMADGGFDCVIGNPPYVDSELMTKFYPEQRSWLSANFTSAKGNWDLYIPFIEQGLRLLKDGGYLGFIVPNKWLSSSYGKSLRNMIHEDIFELVMMTDIQEVFDGVGVYPVLLVLKKGGVDKTLISNFNKTKLVEPIKEIKLEDPQKITSYLSNQNSIVEKLSSSVRKLDEHAKITGAFTTAEAYELKEIIRDSQDGLKFINTGTIDRYANLWGLKKIKYLGLDLVYPSLDPDHFLKLMPRRHELSTEKKLIITGLGKLEAFYDSKGEYIAGKSTVVISKITNIDPYALLAVINSRLINLYLFESNKFKGMRGGDLSYSPDMFKSLPIPSNLVIDIEAVKSLIELWSQHNKLDYEPLSFINSKYGTSYRSLSDIDLSSDQVKTSSNNRKLLKAVSSQPIEKQEEMHRWLEEKQARLDQLKSKIDLLDEQINQEVYKIYSLTPDEIELVEASYRA